MTLKQVLLLVVTATVAAGQRPPFAGSRPIGYPQIITTTAAAATDDLGNRFGEANNTAVSTAPTTTQRLPIEANGDRDLIDRLSKLPIDKQPFWFINWQAYEANRNKPQTYPIRPSSFAQPISPGFDSNSGFNNNFNTGSNQDLGNRNQQNEPTTSNPGNGNNSGINSNVNPAGNNINGGTVGVTSLGNRNSEFDVTNTAKPGPLVQPASPVKVDVDKIPNQDTLGNRNGDVILRFKRDVESEARKPSETLVESEPDSPYEYIRAFQQKAGNTIHNTQEILEPRGKTPTKEEIEKNLQEVIQILDEVNEVYEKYDEVDPEDIPYSGPRTESPVEEAIRLEMCEKKDKLTALLSRPPIKHDKCKS